MNMQESWLNGDGMTNEQEKWRNGEDKSSESSINRTEENLLAITAMLEGVNDPRLVANMAIGAIMVLVKRLMCDEDKENEGS